MGIFTNFVSNCKTFTSADRLAEQMALLAARMGDIVDSGAAARNEVNTIAHNATIDGGTFTLGFNLNNGSAVFTTAAIVFGANAATIQAAINTASPASIADDAIVVTGGNMATTDVVLTYSGASVSGRNQPTVVVGNSLTASAVPVTAPAVTVTADGQPDRSGWSILKAMGVITDSAPAAGVVVVVTAGANLLLTPPWLIKAMAKEIAVQDRNDAVYAGILSGLGMS